MNKFAIAALLLNASAKQVQAATSAQQIVAGMLKGAGIQNVEGKIACMKDVEAIYADVETAVEDFKKKDVQDIIAGITELKDAWGFVQKASTDCVSSSDADKIARIMDALKEPFSFEYAANKLLINNADVKQDVDAFTANFQAGKFEEAGAMIGSISEKTFSGAEQQKVAQMAQGMIQTYGGSFNLEALLICIYEEDQAALALDAAVGLIEDAIHDKDIMEGVAGAIFVFAAYQQALQGLPACEAIDPKAWQSAEWTNSMDILEHPQKYVDRIAKDVAKNAGPILEDMVSAVESYKSGDFVTFGEKLADIIKIATAPDAAPNAITKVEYAQTVQGMIEQFGGKIDIEALLICIYEEDQAALILDEAVQVIEEAVADKDIMEGVIGGFMVFAAYQQAMQGVPACKAISPSFDVKRFQNALDIIEHPKKNMKTIEADIKKNEADLLSILSISVTSYKAGDFNTFGNAMGAVMKTITEPAQVAVSKTEYLQVLQGIAQPFGGSFNLEALLICIYEEDQAALILDEAVQVIEEAVSDKDIMEGVMGAIMIFAAYQQAMQGLPACEAIDAWDVEGFTGSINTLRHYKDNVKLIEADVLKNRENILLDLEASIVAFKEGNFQSFGAQLGDILKQVTEPAPVAKISKNEMAETVQGMIQPFGAKIDIEALLICIYEEDQAALALDAAVTIIEEAIHDKDVIEGVMGAIFVFAAYQQALQGLPACEAIKPSEWNSKGFTSALDILAHPRKNMNLIKDKIIKNEATIIADLETAVAAFRSGDFNMFGQQLGSILEFTQEQTVAADIDRKMVTEVAQGLLEATRVGHFDFTALLFCIYEADQAALILYEGVNIIEEAYKDKDVSEAIGGVIAMIAFVQQLKKSIPVCESVDPATQDWTEFDKIVQTLWDAKSHMSIIEKDIVFNGMTITKDILEAIQAWEQKQYYNFGAKIGETMEAATEYNGSSLFLY